MNWETAKNWLISIFLILDISLGWQLMSSRQQIIGYEESYTDLLASTKTVLAEHSLTLAAPVPTAAPDMPSFRATFSQPALADLSGAVFPKYPIIAADATGGYVITNLGRLKILEVGTWQVVYTAPITIQSVSAIPSYLWHGDEYALDSAASTKQVPVFTQKYNGYPIFDVQATSDVQGNILNGFVQMSIGQISTVGDPKPIISAINALDSLANAVDKSTQYPDNKILKIDLGYARKLSVGPVGPDAQNSNYWFPVWRVSTAAQVYFINAFTGEVDTSP